MFIMVIFLKHDSLYPKHKWMINVCTSCKKSAIPFLSGHRNPQDSKNWRMNSRGPWYTICPSDMSTTSSNNSKVSGAGCSNDMKTVASVRCTICCRHFTIWYVVELSRPVDISSINSVFVGPTIISPVVTLFFWPPDTPLCISSPTIVSWHMSSPNIYICINK